MTEQTTTSIPSGADEPADTETSWSDCLGAAVNALTTAGRRPDTDWAEFVTLALAGAAANLGGIDTALAHRPGSWEAAGVQQLLISTVGWDETHLWQHRTNPVSITLYMERLITDHHPDVNDAYDEAVQEIDRRIVAAQEADPEPSYEPFLWAYRRNPDGDWVSDDPGAPVWSWETWRAEIGDRGVAPVDVAAIEAHAPSKNSLTVGMFLDRYPGAGRQYDQLHDEWEHRVYGDRDLDTALGDQRRAEWAAYSATLAEHIRTQAAQLGLTVPVEVTVDVTTWPAPTTPDPYSLESTLIDQAMSAIPSPAELPGTPLDRLDRATTNHPNDRANNHGTDHSRGPAA